MTQASSAKRSLTVLSAADVDTSLADGQQRLEAHEDAAHEKRNWVRLAFDCNNHCTFCLDSHAHDGLMREDREVRVQIVEGRKKGATRLILSGGEPTMNPYFLEYVKLGRRAGYPKIQTVTNGRMFAYPEFLDTALQNGLSEITFSLHGHTPKLHDRLVGVPGAFVEETAGLRAALATGRVIVNVDIVINKMNVRHLPEMLDTFYGWGVREFDLLQVIPFGNAWSKAKDHLFYDLDDPEIAARIREALAYARKPDVHVWLNRFPPAYTEGYEELIQDPYKLNDEVRGRREEFDRYLSIGQKLMCREPERCKHCYLQGLCDTLDVVLEDRKADQLPAIRLDRAGPRPGSLPRAHLAHLVAKDVEAARELLQAVEATELALELDEYEGFEGAFSLPVRRLVAKTKTQLDALHALPGDWDLHVWLTRETAEALRALPSVSPRVVLVQPTYGRASENRDLDVLDVRALLDEVGPLRTAGLAACLSGQDPEPAQRTLDAAMLGTDGRIDMPKYAARYAESRFFSKSIRCRDCAKASTCDGMHINWIRAHGYGRLSPIR